MQARLSCSYVLALKIFQMKIAINATSIGHGMTGIGSFTRELVHATSRYGSSHSYLYFGKKQNISVQEKKQRKVIQVDSPNLMWEQLQLPSALNRQKADLYHTPFFTCPVVQNVPSLITVHDVIPEIRPDLCSAAFLAFYKKWIKPGLRAATAILTVSEFSRQQIVQYLKVDPESVHVAYQGVHDVFFRQPEDPARVRARYAIPHHYVLHVGMVEPRKNLEQLIRAFKPLAKKIKDIALVFVGRKDSDAYSLDPVVDDSGLTGRVLQVGYVPDEDLPAIYADARAFAFPSLYEGFGRPVVEAMAAGVPVLASGTTSLPEIIDDAGITVDPENEQMMAEALQRLVTDKPLRQCLINRGRKRAADFTIQKFAQRLVDIYERIGSSQ